MGRFETGSWDWIYDGYAGLGERLEPYAAFFDELFVQSRVRIQTQPVCRPAAADLTTRPVSRKPRHGAAEVRNKLGIAGHAPLLLITMGGIPMQLDFLGAVQKLEEVVFVVCGTRQPAQMRGNLILLRDGGQTDSVARQRKEIRTWVQQRVFWFSAKALSSACSTPFFS